MSQNKNEGTDLVKRGLAEMLKGGVIMDVVTPEQAKIAEDAGAVAVMALERVPADIRAEGGVARMSDPDLISDRHTDTQITLTRPTKVSCLAQPSNTTTHCVDAPYYSSPYTQMLLAGWL